MRTFATVAALVTLVYSSAALAQAQQPPAAPPPGSPALYKSSVELSAALKEAAGRAAGGTLTAAVSNTDQYRINVVHRTQAATPLTHAGNTEVHHIIDGAATVVTGGTVVRSSSGAVVEGGVSRHVTKGDVLLVPADTPHWYKDVEGSVTYLEVRFVVPAK